MTALLWLLFVMMNVARNTSFFLGKDVGGSTVKAAIKRGFNLPITSAVGIFRIGFLAGATAQRFFVLRSFVSGPDRTNHRVGVGVGAYRTYHIVCIMFIQSYWSKDYVSHWFPSHRRSPSSTFWQIVVPVVVGRQQPVDDRHCRFLGGRKLSFTTRHDETYQYEKNRCSSMDCLEPLRQGGGEQSRRPETRSEPWVVAATDHGGRSRRRTLNVSIVAIVSSNSCPSEGIRD